MLLTTERLRIVPLTPRQLGLWLYDIPALGKELDCRYTAGSPHGDSRRIVEGQHALAAADPGNHLFHTFWFLICKGPGSIPPKRTQLDGGACETRLPPGKYRRPFLRTAFCIFVDPEASIRNSGFPGSGADSWREKLFPTTGRLPQSHSSIPLSVFFIRSWSRKSLRSS